MSNLFNFSRILDKSTPDMIYTVEQKTFLSKAIQIVEEHDNSVRECTEKLYKSLLEADSVKEENPKFAQYFKDLKNVILKTIEKANQLAAQFSMQIETFVDVNKDLYDISRNDKVNNSTFKGVEYTNLLKEDIPNIDPYAAFKSEFAMLGGLLQDLGPMGTEEDRVAIIATVCNNLAKKLDDDWLSKVVEKIACEDDCEKDSFARVMYNKFVKEGEQEITLDTATVKQAKLSLMNSSQYVTSIMNTVNAMCTGFIKVANEIGSLFFRNKDHKFDIVVDDENVANTTYRFNDYGYNQINKFITTKISQLNELANLYLIGLSIKMDCTYKYLEQCRDMIEAAINNNCDTTDMNKDDTVGDTSNTTTDDNAPTNDDNPQEGDNTEGEDNSEEDDEVPADKAPVSEDDNTDEEEDEDEPPVSEEDSSTEEETPEEEEAPQPPSEAEMDNDLDEETEEFRLKESEDNNDTDTPEDNNEEETAEEGDEEPPTLEESVSNICVDAYLLEADIFEAIREYNHYVFKNNMMSYINEDNMPTVNNNGGGESRAAKIIAKIKNLIEKFKALFRENKTSMIEYTNLVSQLINDATVADGTTIKRIDVSKFTNGFKFDAYTPNRMWTDDEEYLKSQYSSYVSTDNTDMSIRDRIFKACVPEQESPYKQEYIGEDVKFITSSYKTMSDNVDNLNKELDKIKTEKNVSDQEVEKAKEEAKGDEGNNNGNNEQNAGEGGEAKEGTEESVRYTESNTMRYYFTEADDDQQNNNQNNNDAKKKPESEVYLNVNYKLAAAVMSLFDRKFDQCFNFVEYFAKAKGANSYKDWRESKVLMRQNNQGENK